MPRARPLRPRFSRPRSSCFGVRPGRACALGGSERSGRSHRGIGGGPCRAGRLSAGAPRALPRRGVAARVEARRRSVRRVQGADRRCAGRGTARQTGLAAALNNLGIVQIRRGATPQTGTAAFYLTKATDADPGDADYLFNLGYAYVLERNDQGAIYWLREGAPARSGGPGRPLRSGGRASGIGQRRRSGPREGACAAAVVPVRRARAPRGGRQVARPERPRACARWSPMRHGGLRPEQAIVNSAQREQRELATFHLDRGRRLFEREADREAMVELRRAVYLSPYEAQAHLLIGRIHLRAGRPQEAVDALKISIWSEDTAAARIALADAYLRLQNTAAARTELERALALDPASADAKRLLGRRSSRHQLTKGASGARFAGTALGRPAASRTLDGLRPAAARRSTPPRSTASSIRWPPNTCANSIAKADAAGAALVVLTLRTPGGLVDSTRDINNAIIHAKTPVAVFVGPSGNRAASAGFLITIAADIAAMAPGDAHRRRASRRRQRREDRRHDGEEDGLRRRGLRAHARDAAEAQRRAGRTGRAREPLLHRAGGDVGATRRSSISSRTTCRTSSASLTDGRSPVSTAPRRRSTPRRRRTTNVAMTWQQAVLSAIAHPQIAYLLLTLGHARADHRAVEPRRDPAGRRRRHLPAARVFRVPGPAGELRRDPADPVRPRTARPRGEGHELRPARGRRGRSRCSWAR